MLNVDGPFVWKMRNGIESIPTGKRDQFRAARGILWWLLASILVWSLAAVVFISL